MYYFLWLNITNILPMPLPPSTYFLDRKATSWKEKEKHKGEEEKEAKTFPLSLFFLSSNSIIIIIMNLG